MTEGATDRTAIVLMGFGGPDRLESVRPFMRNLMGREPSDELVARVERRYLTIGGESPLPEIAHQIAQAVEAKFAEEGKEVPTVLGMRYWPPFIGETLRGLHHHGFRKVIAVSLSPFDSKTTTGAYRTVVDEVVEDLEGLEVVWAPPLHTLTGFGGLHTGAAAEALTDLKDHQPTLLVFSAHSLPLDDSEDSERYVAQLRGVVERLVSIMQMGEGAELDGADARLAGIRAYGSLEDPLPWVLAYQSKGERECEWLGPNVSDVADAAIEGGVFKSIAVSPIGFAIDNLETRYDLDVVLAGKVFNADLEFARATVPNADELLVNSIFDAVNELL